MPEGSQDLTKVIQYIESHWHSSLPPELQVNIKDYPAILNKVIHDFTMYVSRAGDATWGPPIELDENGGKVAAGPARAGATKNHKIFRIAGVSGSGKTTQILPAVEAYCEKNNYEPILMAARRFVEYHPHFEEIKEYYGEENLRKNTDEFCTIMLFLTLSALMKNGYDIVLDVTLLDPKMEAILLKMIKSENYQFLILMIAVSPTVTEKYLSNRAWRHSKATEQEFIRATSKALSFYADNIPDTRIIIWSVYDKPPVYDGPVKGCLDIFNDYSSMETLPKPDDDERRDAKIQYLSNTDYIS